MSCQLRRTSQCDNTPFCSVCWKLCQKTNNFVSVSQGPVSVAGVENRCTKVTCCHIKLVSSQCFLYFEILSLLRSFLPHFAWSVFPPPCMSLYHFVVAFVICKLLFQTYTNKFVWCFYFTCYILHCSGYQRYIYTTYSFLCIVCLLSSASLAL